MEFSCVYLTAPIATDNIHSFQPSLTVPKNFPRNSIIKICKMRWCSETQFLRYLCLVNICMHLDSKQVTTILPEVQLLYPLYPWKGGCSWLLWRHSSHQACEHWTHWRSDMDGTWGIRKEFYDSYMYQEYVHWHIWCISNNEMGIQRGCASATQGSDSKL